MDKKKVTNFITYYLNPNGKPYEAITEYIKVDQKRIDQDQDEIIKFYIKNFKVGDSVTRIESLMPLEEIKTIEDLDLLENIIAVGIASNILKDDFRVRFELFDKLGKENLVFFMRDEFDLSDKDFQEQYVDVLNSYILPYMYFLTDVNLLKKYKEVGKINMTQNEIKMLLSFWFTSGGKVEPTNEQDGLFRYLLDNRFEEMFNACAYLRIQKMGPEFIKFQMLIDRNLTFIDEINDKVKKFTPEQMDMFKQVKVQFIDELDHILKENNSKKR